ncbi:uncharacterized protein EDB93DRAFT_496801 [Suillus bovinus]|uniref:uncharacterized protein n=1 Tax=Suillus bovinus TaxID=48563 RepID=UPI001B869E96|nr:uncharacterized protein EDB93DRAFT_496801 [Suillus bovinus]KAG2146003.1 hypothetical protein EDB93DRAFT_496801 [Suillus bovinus]
MHRALLISEVLSEIFAHLNENRIAGKKPSSLEALARTCKAFHEPAMDLLWAVLDGVIPLLGCVARLHRLIYSSGSKVSPDLSCLFLFASSLNLQKRLTWDWSEGVDPLSAHEAHRFLEHAARVRSLSISCSEDLHLFALLPIETCMFPRLLSLTFLVRRLQHKYLYLFLSPALRRCVLSVVTPELKSLATRCAALEHLSVKTPEWGQQPVDDRILLSDTVRLCKRLVTLSCLPLDWAAWKHLSDLPSLLKVSVRELRSAFRWSLNRDIVNFTHFPNVTTLSFNVNTAAYAITVMQHSEFPSLREFEVVTDVLPCVEAEQLFSALSQCKAEQTLGHIAITSLFPKVSKPSCDSLAAVTQLLCFTHLRTVRLNLHHCIDIDNDLLLKVVSSWPRIRSLELVDSKMLPAVTLRGLFAALRLCPYLHTLRTLVNAANIDFDPAAESFQHTTLQTLDLIQSDVTDAEAVAHIIFSVLPCVDRIRTRKDPRHGTVYQTRWDEVNRHLKDLKSSEVVGGDITGTVTES